MSQQGPYRVSDALLARQNFRDACLARDFGAAFRLMRKCDGAPQDRICSPVEGLTQSRVSMIMRAEDRISGLDIVERLVDGLHIPGSYVGLATRDGEQVVDPCPTHRSVVPDPVTAAVRTQSATTARPTGASNGAPPAQQGHLSTAPAQEPPPASVRVERPVGLRPQIERAFATDTVTIDFSGFSGETLAGALGEPLDKVRSGELKPSTIRVRVLVPDASRPWTFPCRIEDLGDEPAFRQRAAAIVDRSLSTIIDAVTELKDRELVADAVAEVRVHAMTPQFKLYVINGRDVFFGFYPVAEHTVKTRGELHAMYDVMGKDSVLFHHCDDGEAAAAHYVSQARIWFESVWAGVARDYTRG